MKISTLMKVTLLSLIIYTTGCDKENSNKDNKVFDKKDKAVVNQGQERGNGGDYLTAEYKSAWFLGEGKTVLYCVDMAPNFGVSKEKAVKAINYAITTWSDYIETKKVNRRIPKMKLVTNWQQISNCDGTEDVAFYFGVRNEKVNRAMAQFFNPVAFAVKTHYDMKSGWGKGFIWVASRGSVSVANGSTAQDFPDWQTPYNLEGIILHETGHIFGNGHIPFTIMDKDFVHRLMEPHTHHDEPFRYSQLMMIDQARELAICDNCQQLINGRLGLYFWSDEGRRNQQGEIVRNRKVVDTRAKVFQKLFARQPVGELKASVNIDGKGGMALTVKDSVEEATFEIITPSGGADSFTLDELAFKSITSESDDMLLSSLNIAKSGSEVSYGHLTTQSGTRLHLVIQRNMVSSIEEENDIYIFANRFLVQFLDEVDGMQILFQSEQEHP